MNFPPINYNILWPLPQIPELTALIMVRIKAFLPELHAKEYSLLFWALARLGYKEEEHLMAGAPSASGQLRGPADGASSPSSLPPMDQRLRLSDLVARCTPILDEFVAQV